MDLRDLVSALVERDALAARQWVQEARSAGLDWSLVPEPVGLDPLERAVAAGIVELLADRSHRVPPAWTESVPAAPTQLFLVQAAESMPRLRKSCLEQGPWSFGAAASSRAGLPDAGVTPEPSAGTGRSARSTREAEVLTPPPAPGETPASTGLPR